MIARDGRGERCDRGRVAHPTLRKEGSGGGGVLDLAVLEEWAELLPGATEEDLLGWQWGAHVCMIHMHMRTCTCTHEHMHMRVRADLARREVPSASALDRHERRGGKALPRSRL